MKKLVLFFIILSFLTGCTPEKNEKPEVFIISLEKYIDYQGRDMWLFNYAINGEVHQAVFNNTTRAQDYLEYLHTIGNIKGGAL